MKEKDFYNKLNRYYTDHARTSLAIEVKITKKDYISFSSLMMHQEHFLYQSERRFAYKIADLGISKKPFDMFVLHNAEALIVVIFYRPRKSLIYEIPFRRFVKERENSTRRSLTLNRAEQIGTRVFL